jgi:hypothetical protein
LNAESNRWQTRSLANAAPRVKTSQRLRSADPRLLSENIQPYCMDTAKAIKSRGRDEGSAADSAAAKFEEGQD